jgi:hypothetical protein
MSVTKAMRIQRVTVPAGGSPTGITPPAPFTQCYVGNLTGTDLYIYTNDDVAQNEYRLLSANAERPLRALQTRGFRHTETAFWLYSVGGGTVILEWT